MSDGNESSGEGLAPKRRRYLTTAEKKRLLEKFYQIPQPCSQREAAAMLNISQATFSRLIGDRFAKKIYETDVRAGKSERVKRGRPKKIDSPREMKKLAIGEKIDLLKKYDELQPCSQRKAAKLMKVPQSTLWDLLKARNELIDEVDRKQGCRDNVESTSRASVKIADYRTPFGRCPPPPRKRRPPKRFDFDASEEVMDTSDEEYGPSEDSDESSEDYSSNKLNAKQENILREYVKLTKSSRCSQREAAEKLGVKLSALRIVLKAVGGIEKKPTVHVLKKPTVNVLNSEKNEITPKDLGEVKISETSEIAELTLEDRRHKMRSLPDKIKIFRLFDAMQPCSQNKARAVLKMSSSTLSCLIANRKAIEEDFRKQLDDNIQVLKKYDSLESHQLPRAHLICGLPKSKLEHILDNREFWVEEAANHEGASVGPNVVPVTEMERVEKELLSWYQANRSQEITWLQLMNKARELAKSAGSKFIPSDPWMSKWKRKVTHLLKPRPDPSPVVAARVDCVNESSTVLPALKDYHPDDIFNLDETGVYYRAMPGFVPDKDDWVTVLFACNMSGTEKKRLTVVGKSEAPLFFGILSLPLNYKHSSDGRMSQEILSNLLEEWNTQLRADNRNIALILDNCSMHINIDLELDHISLFFVSNNSPTPSQPLNRGIISYTKTLFRKKLFQTVYKLVDDAKAVNDLVSKITLLDSLYMLAEAWHEVPGKVIINAFAELVFPNLSHPVPDEEPEEDIVRLNQLDDDLMSISSENDVRECMEDELSNEDYMVVHIEGVVDPSEGEIEDVTAIEASSAQHSSSNSSGLESELRKFLDSSGFAVSQKSPKMAAVNVKDDNILAESLCNDLGLSKSLEKEPPSSAEVHEALGVIKRFLRMNGGTLEDFTDFTQLEMKVLSKMKS